MNKKIKFISRIILLLYLIAVGYLCFANFKSVPKFAHNDKTMHFMLFIPYAFLIYFSTGKHWANKWKALGYTLLLFLSGAMIAGLTEIIQGRLPYRSADPLDFRADIIAIAITSLTVFIIELCSRKS